jgi:hypothetical protein
LVTSSNCWRHWLHKKKQATKTRKSWWQMPRKEQRNYMQLRVTWKIN